jgi:hypothetical protein
VHETGLGEVTAPPHLSFSDSHPLQFTQKDSNDFLTKYLYPQVMKQNSSYARLTSGSFLGRAAYAASSIFVTRDASGRGRLNTSNFLGMLTMAASHTAYRYPGSRSASAAFNDFGVSIGSNAGMNVYHEFEPGIRQKVRDLTPKFVYRIGEHITHDQTPKD